MEKSFREFPDGVEIRVFIQPRSSKTRIVGRHGEEIKVRVASPPLDGKANEELGRYLAKEFGVPQRWVEIVSGACSRHKRVLIKGKTLSDLMTRLSEVMGSESD